MVILIKHFEGIVYMPTKKRRITPKRKQKGAGVIAKGMEYQTAFMKFLGMSEWSILSNNTISGLILKCDLKEEFKNSSPFISTRLNSLNQHIKTILVKIMIVDDKIKHESQRFVSFEGPEIKEQSGEKKIYTLRDGGHHANRVELQTSNMIRNEMNIQTNIAIRTALSEDFKFMTLNSITPFIFGANTISKSALLTIDNDGHYPQPLDLPTEINKKFEEELDKHILSCIQPNILNYVKKDHQLRFAKFLYFLVHRGEGIIMLGMEFLEGAETQGVIEKKEDITINDKLNIRLNTVWSIVLLQELGYVHQDLHWGNVMHIFDKDDNKKNDIFLIDFGRTRPLTIEESNIIQNANTGDLTNNLIVRLSIEYNSPHYVRLKYKYINDITWLLRNTNYGKILKIDKFITQICPLGKNTSRIYLSQPNASRYEEFKKKIETFQGTMYGLVRPLPILQREINEPTEPTEPTEPDSPIHGSPEPPEPPTHNLGGKVANLPPNSVFNNPIHPSIIDYVSEKIPISDQQPKNVNDLFSMKTIEYTDPYEEEYIDDNKELEKITEYKDNFNTYIDNLIEEEKKTIPEEQMNTLFSNLNEQFVLEYLDSNYKIPEWDLSITPKIAGKKKAGKKKRTKKKKSRTRK